MTPIRKGTELAAACRAVFLLALDATHPAVRLGARVIAFSWVLGIVSWLWLLLIVLAHWV